MKNLLNLIRKDKPRFKVRKYINGIGFIVWDTKLQRTYRAFQRETDAKLCRDLLNKSGKYNQ